MIIYLFNKTRIECTEIEFTPDGSVLCYSDSDGYRKIPTADIVRIRPARK